MGDSVRGVPGSAHLAAATSALGRARPPPARSQDRVAPAPRGQAPRSSPPQPGTHLPSLPRRLSLSVKRALRYAAQGPGAGSAVPRLLLLGLPIGRGRHHLRRRGRVGGARGRAQVGLGAGPGGAGALTALLRAGSILGLRAAAQRRSGWTAGLARSCR